MIYFLKAVICFIIVQAGFSLVEKWWDKSGWLFVPTLLVIVGMVFSFFGGLAFFLMFVEWAYNIIKGIV